MARQRRVQSSHIVSSLLKGASGSQRRKRRAGLRRERHKARGGLAFGELRSRYLKAAYFDT